MYKWCYSAYIILQLALLFKRKHLGFTGAADSCGSSLFLTQMNKRKHRHTHVGVINTCGYN